jgi:hypothetical protein
VEGEEVARGRMRRTERRLEEEEECGQKRRQSDF